MKKERYVTLAIGDDWSLLRKKSYSVSVFF